MLNMTIKMSRLTIFATMLLATTCLSAAEPETIDVQVEENSIEAESAPALREILGGDEEEPESVAELLEEQDVAGSCDQKKVPAPAGGKEIERGGQKCRHGNAGNARAVSVESRDQVRKKGEKVYRFLSQVL